MAYSGYPVSTHLANPSVDIDIGCGSDLAFLFLFWVINKITKSKSVNGKGEIYFTNLKWKFVEVSAASSLARSLPEEDNRRRLLRRERLNSIASASLHGVNRDHLQCNSEEKEADESSKRREEFLKEVLWH